MFGKSQFHKNAIEQIGNGNKLICLAISEMSGGSDVKSIKTTARLSNDGSHYIVNGNKYWITGFETYMPFYQTHVNVPNNEN